MLDTIFLITALVGGTVMLCQFALTVMGLAGDEVDGAGDFSADADFDGDVSGDIGGADGGDVASGDGVEGDHQSHWSEADDPDVSHPDSSGMFKIVSFRTMVAAIAFFGMTGAAARSAEIGNAPSVLIALAGGFAAMYGTYYLMQSITKLDSSGNEDITNAIGQAATVYVPIPAAQGGMGKVQLSMQNRIVEFKAVTAEDDPLKTGEAVVVVAVTSGDTLEVRRAESMAAV
ncbi:NfeD family protein [Adhaeretor mobilis]|uniref:NfeD-like C-terminal domain-containing protein n=1 Tax=Adhaeretor mobilis TaxID=1930276 RepID=A0A517MSF9_9BACT|nr:hypothetical protein [Adhaeretor mobilis]QDS97808.1 hypothetical protein HG15A2_10750 [Adhaeretor mobilis]